MKRCKNHFKGFTLIELLVVIAIIALLLSILLPSLSIAKDHAKKIGCSNNLRTLSIAARLYGNDNESRTPSSTNYWSSSTGTRAGWCGRTTKGDHTPYPRDIQIFGDGDGIKGLENGQLWSYVNTIKVWRCPTDPEKEQLRSYCMAGQWWGHYTNSNNSIPVLIQGNIKPRIAFRKISNISNPDSRFMFVDQLGANSDGYAAIWYNRPMWWNIPNYRHSGGSINGFADGHVEGYKMNKKTVDLAEESLATNIQNGFRMIQTDCSTDEALKEDLIYYQRATWGEIAW